uniref:Uncharacterized protein n=1 Tax=Vombatus ursinus TaxID=29139 RepID=A0A4X2KFU3_VOMUR
GGCFNTHFIPIGIFSHSLVCCFLLWMAALDFTVTFLEAFKFGPTLFKCSEKAILPKSLSNSSIHLAITVAVPEGFIKLMHTNSYKKNIQRHPERVQWYTEI